MNAKGINVADFKERVDVDARARAMFYEHKDAGQLDHIADWSSAPWYLREMFRSLAAHESKYQREYAARHQTTVRPTRWYHKIAALFSREGRS